MKTLSQLGEIREEDISKDNLEFARTPFILPQADEIFARLKQDNYLQGHDREHFSRKSALLMADLNHLHPFREGNGRSLREFIRCLALRAGYSIDWRRADSKEILLATIESVTDESHLEELIYRCISK
ncbi:Fic/DOC family protein [Paenibacillus pasadenensis]|uniref:Fic/DOC family protein n=1 Tax=Paenibacillus pasadenensis TaxID=217090 RepID=UPI0015E0A811|nr:Fic family protein [Paenibacillus pasadenensis]